MLFTSPINTITWAEIEDFCNQQIKEGANLDYKENFPNDLAKTLAAMANTFGGIILIGIEETENNTPKLPIKGIEFKRGLEEKVTSIIFSNIVPAFLPEIQVCKNDDGERAVIVIRIPQSAQAPHAIAKNTKVYVRTGNKNEPEELATLDQLTWLTSQRSKSVELKNKLLEQCKARLEFLNSSTIEKCKSDGKQITIPTTGLLTIYFVPSYPSKIFLYPNEIRDYLETIQVKDYYGTTDKFPWRDKRIVQNGCISTFFNSDNYRLFYFEANSFGLIYYHQILKRDCTYFSHSEFFKGRELIARLIMLRDIANNLYNKLGYVGDLDFNMSLDNIRGFRLSFLDEQIESDQVENSICWDNEIKFFKCVSSTELSTENERLVTESVKKLGWTFNYNLSDDKIIELQNKVINY